jgi:hypothetical protein
MFVKKEIEEKNHLFQCLAKSFLIMGELVDKLDAKTKSPRLLIIQ